MDFALLATELRIAGKGRATPKDKPLPVVRTLLDGFTTGASASTPSGAGTGDSGGASVGAGGLPAASTRADLTSTADGRRGGAAIDPPSGVADSSAVRTGTGDRAANSGAPAAAAPAPAGSGAPVAPTFAAGGVIGAGRTAAVAPLLTREDAARHFEGPHAAILVNIFVPHDGLWSHFAARPVAGAAVAPATKESAFVRFLRQTVARHNGGASLPGGSGGTPLSFSLRVPASMSVNALATRAFGELLRLRAASGLGTELAPTSPYFGAAADDVAGNALGAGSDAASLGLLLADAQVGVADCAGTCRVPLRRLVPNGKGVTLQPPAAVFAGGAVGPCGRPSHTTTSAAATGATAGAAPAGRQTPPPALEPIGVSFVHCNDSFGVAGSPVDAPAPLTPSCSLPSPGLASLRASTTAFASSIGGRSAGTSVAEAATPHAGGVATAAALATRAAAAPPSLAAAVERAANERLLAVAARQRLHFSHKGLAALLASKSFPPQPRAPSLCAPGAGDAAAAAALASLGVSSAAAGPAPSAATAAAGAGVSCALPPYNFVLFVPSEVLLQRRLLAAERAARRDAEAAVFVGFRLFASGFATLISSDVSARLRWAAHEQSVRAALLAAFVSDGRDAARRAVASHEAVGRVVIIAAADLATATTAEAAKEQTQLAVTALFSRATRVEAPEASARSVLAAAFAAVVASAACETRLRQRFAEVVVGPGEALLAEAARAMVGAMHDAMVVAVGGGPRS